MSGPAPKPVARRQRRNKTPELVVQDGGGNALLPPASRYWLKQTRDAWADYWGSALAQIVEEDTDGPAIRRLFNLNDERERAYRGYRQDRLVIGSQGQRVINPLARVMSALDAEIRQLEDRLGLTPKARLQLGITYGEAAKSLEALNSALGGDDGDDDETKEEDPRLAAV